jgi:ubiquinone biosynthesis protein COQ4
MMATTTLDAHAPPVSDEQREEAEAVRLALEGRFFPRMRLALRALHRLRKNPNDTRQVFVLSLAVSGSHLPVLLTKFLSSQSGVELLSRRAAIDSTSVDYDMLRALPADTLGGAYVRFLDDNGLDPDLFQAPPGLPPGVAYIVQRMRQTHDLWHVITGHDSDIPGELSVLAFTWGQTGSPSMRLLATAGAIRYSLTFRGIIGRVFRNYLRGKHTPFLGNVAWETMWHLPVAEVRARLQVRDA